MILSPCRRVAVVKSCRRVLVSSFCLVPCFGVSDYREISPNTTTETDKLAETTLENVPSAQSDDAELRTTTFRVVFSGVELATSVRKLRTSTSPGIKLETDPNSDFDVAVLIFKASCTFREVSTCVRTNSPASYAGTDKSDSSDCASK